jgi:nicotinamidase-related amidase
MGAVADAQDHFRPESPGAQLVLEMAATRGRIVDNQKLSGLADNGLPEWLRARAIDTLWMTGVATHLTVEQTARHGTDLGFTVHVIRDCTAAASEDVHEASLANLDLATAGCRAADEVLATIT